MCHNTWVQRYILCCLPETIQEVQPNADVCPIAIWTVWTQVCVFGNDRKQTYCIKRHCKANKCVTTLECTVTSSSASLKPFKRWNRMQTSVLSQYGLWEPKFVFWGWKETNLLHKSPLQGKQMCHNTWVQRYILCCLPETIQEVQPDADVCPIAIWPVWTQVCVFGDERKQTYCIKRHCKANKCVTKIDCYVTSSAASLKPFKRCNRMQTSVLSRNGLCEPKFVFWGW